MKKLIVFFLIGFAVNAQNPLRFSKEVKLLEEKYSSYDSSKESIVFVGSSSIKYWTNIHKDFPNHQIINNGFGGSEASDLVYFTENLILKYSPKKVFIYEGDNDIQSGKKTKTILKDLKIIVNKIKENNRETEVILIAAKPSIARWKLKKSYHKLNRRMKKMAKKDVNLYFADIWTPMLDGKTVKKNIFVGDNLHMNTEGYKIWYNVLKNYVN